MFIICSWKVGRSDKTRYNPSVDQTNAFSPAGHSVVSSSGITVQYNKLGSRLQPTRSRATSSFRAISSHRAGSARLRPPPPPEKSMCGGDLHGGGIHLRRASDGSGGGNALGGAACGATSSSPALVVAAARARAVPARRTAGTGGAAARWSPTLSVPCPWTAARASSRREQQASRIW